MNPLEYAKAIAALIGTSITAILGVTPDAPHWLVIAGVVATAVATFVVPNRAPEQVTGDHTA